MGKSARPKWTNTTLACKKCGKMTKRFSSTGECDSCNPLRFSKEFPAQKGQGTTGIKQ